MAITILPTIDETGESYDLPQYGFGAAVDFGSLVRTNRFLFRVHTPKHRTPPPGSDSITPFFVASKYDAEYTLLADEILRGQTPIEPSAVSFREGTYEDIATHMDWMTRHHSAYISTSFSFAWAIWEALRRYHSGVKQDVQIAVIDAFSISHKAVTAADMLKSVPESGRRAEHWQWHRFAQESQAVLVHQYIPSCAVLASIPILSILEKLPSYFLRAPPVPGNEKSILSNLGWDYTNKKQSFRQFCQVMSNRFLQLPADAKLEAATTCSIRLALTFLRPWIERTASSEGGIDNASNMLFSLSVLIAQWPGKWWAEEHTELLNIIQGISGSLIGEFKKPEVNDDAPLTSPIDDWFEKHPSQSPVDAANSRWIPPLVIPPMLGGLKPVQTVASPSPLALNRSPAVIPQPSKLSNEISAPSPRPSTPPRTASQVVTPITPPQSPPRPPPRPRLASDASLSSIGSWTMPSPTTTVGNSSQEKLAHFEDDTICVGVTDLEDPFTVGPSKGAKTLPVVEEKVEEVVNEDYLYRKQVEAITMTPYPLPNELPSAVEEEVVEEVKLVSPPPSPPAPPALSIDTDPINMRSGAAKPALSTTPIQRKRSDVSSGGSLSSFWDCVPSPSRWRPQREPTLWEKAGCIVGGFIVGAWITVAIVGPQARPLLVRT